MASDAIIARLRAQLRRGEVVLVTGAGFSLDAFNRQGDHLPTSGQLAHALWDIAFPATAYDGSRLGDVFSIAVRQARNRTKELIESLLRVDSDRLPESYAQWFAIPWRRIYTVNMDDLAEAVARSAELPRRLVSISAIGDSAVPDATDLLYVHLNGDLDDFPHATFAPQQYGQRLAGTDPWYRHLAADMLGKPVVYVGTELDEPPLWQCVEIRGPRREGAEIRPGSYLVTPTISEARREMLREFNIDWFQMGQREFLEQVLIPLEDETREGLRVLRRRHGGERATDLLTNVADARREQRDDLREFLLGREPHWADMVNGFAVSRNFDADLDAAAEWPDTGVILLMGTAGSGKTTTLMQFALRQQAAGKDVRWVNPETEVSIPRLRAAVRTTRPEIVILDDVDRFSRASGPLLAELVDDSPDTLVVAAARTSRVHQLDLGGHLPPNSVELSVPGLEDSDVDALLDALERANRLGRLLALDPDARRREFTDRAGRQLIVAMMEATSGRRFGELIDDECRELGLNLGHTYAVVALGTHLRAPLTRHEIMLASGDPQEGAQHVRVLLQQHLFIETARDQIRVRHRVIADRAVEYFESQNQLAEPLRGLMFAIATEARGRDFRRTREGKLLIRLLDHDFLQRSLRNDPAGVRRAYDAVEDVLSWDHHYWLQRGSFEVERGEDLAAAEIFLEQARGIAPDDYKVQTEWAYLVLKRASQNPRGAGAAERAAEALETLEDAAIRRGRDDHYPYHILGSQGLAWSRRASLSSEERTRLLLRLKGVVDEGAGRHPRSVELAQLAADLEGEYVRSAAGLL